MEPASVTPGTFRTEQAYAELTRRRLLTTAGAAVTAAFAAEFLPINVRKAVTFVKA